LTAEKATAADLQTQLTSAKSDLTASNAKVSSLTSDLATSNAKVTSLTSDLAIANGKVITIQASLDKANSDLAAANTTIATQNGTLKKVQDPRHFGSLAELQAWVSSDDTNTKYASYSNIDRAFVLQTKALRDGYLLPVNLSYDTQYYYVTNMAVIGNSVYYVYSATDAVVFQIQIVQTPLLHPLPLP
jgi:hypothetical protein